MILKCQLLYCFASCVGTILIVLFLNRYWNCSSGGRDGTTETRQDVEAQAGDCYCNTRAPVGDDSR